eukprot:TRINITY_DN6343_c0_g1_i1.p1 TRINITY_DN6343_c0_g1~~TRINITY_DN6343_c0_g1_i1.p1  ORF type:complete len:1142 (+),score=267.22 TRINITY_DN6343_c0_g1_i1:516-3941(+)
MENQFLCRRRTALSSQFQEAQRDPSRSFLLFLRCRATSGSASDQRSASPNISETRHCQQSCDSAVNCAILFALCDFQPDVALYVVLTNRGNTTGIVTPNYEYRSKAADPFYMGNSPKVNQVGSVVGAVNIYQLVWEKPNPYGLLRTISVSAAPGQLSLAILSVTNGTCSELMSDWDGSEFTLSDCLMRSELYIRSVVVLPGNNFNVSYFLQPSNAPNISFDETFVLRDNDSYPTSFMVPVSDNSSAFFEFAQFKAIVPPMTNISTRVTRGSLYISGGQYQCDVDVSEHSLAFETEEEAAVFVQQIPMCEFETEGNLFWHATVPSFDNSDRELITVEVTKAEVFYIPMGDTVNVYSYPVDVDSTEIYFRVVLPDQTNNRFVTAYLDGSTCDFSEYRMQMLIAYNLCDGTQVRCNLFDTQMNCSVSFPVCSSINSASLLVTIQGNSGFPNCSDGLHLTVFTEGNIKELSTTSPMHAQMIRSIPEIFTTRAPLDQQVFLRVDFPSTMVDPNLDYYIGTTCGLDGDSDEIPPYDYYSVCRSNPCIIPLSEYGGKGGPRWLRLVTFQVYNITITPLKGNEMCSPINKTSICYQKDFIYYATFPDSYELAEQEYKIRMGSQTQNGNELTDRCEMAIRYFACSGFFSLCYDASQVSAIPCRSRCMAIKAACENDVSSAYDCDDFPESGCNMFYPDDYQADGTTGEISDGSPSPDNNNRDGIIAGATVGALAFVALITAAVAFFIIHRKKSAAPPGDSTPWDPKKEVTLKDLELSMSPSQQSARSFDSIPEITGIHIVRKIARGRFGEVFLADWEGVNVAMKKLKNSQDMAEFQHEATILYNLIHPHIVQFMGNYIDEQGGQYIVLEYMSLGSLKDLLVKEKLNLDFGDLVEMMVGACKGMVFLTGRKILHRDLGVRNLLCSYVDRKYVVKISDFGLSRNGDLRETAITKREAETGAKNTSKKKSNNADETIYVLGKKAAIPVKWSAPEVIEERVYTSKSDVWSFGIVMWEILSFGAQPYGWLTLTEAMFEIPKGTRMTQPKNCPDRLWEIILQCWDLNPDKRPTFSELLKCLQEFTARRESTAVLPRQSSGGTNYAEDQKHVYTNVPLVQPPTVTEEKEKEYKESSASYKDDSLGSYKSASASVSSFE